MAEHTPGPWSAEKAVKRNGYWEADIRVGRPANAGNILATTFMGAGGGLINSQAAVEANARLIAAAPAMLEALTDIAVYGCGMLGQPAAVNGPEEAWLRKRIAEYERVARAALASADATDGDQK